MANFEKTTLMPVTSDELFAWHERPGALERLVPPWERVLIERKDPGLQKGSEVHLKTRIGPFWIRWLARHISYIPGKEFVDIQVKGPFAKWEHHHKMIEAQEGSSYLEDAITYRLPFGLSDSLAKKDIERMFTYRHTTTQTDLKLQNEVSKGPLKIAMTGATGLVGSALKALLLTQGHSVYCIPRKKKNPHSFDLDTNALEELDAVYHLAGENIGSGRWSQKKKDAIRLSRVEGTEQLVKTLNNLKKPPKVLISVSGVGYYGSRCKDAVSEKSPLGSDFLATVCQEWEEKALSYSQGRVVIPRLGVVLSPKGGALQKMLPPFRLGLGGPLGSGTQKMSWIAIDDLIYHLYRFITNQSIEGPINLASPYPVTNQEFTQVLAKVLHRPAFFSVPTFILKLAFGEMAEATVLSDIKASSAKLESLSGPFYYPELEKSLRHMLGR